MNENNADLDEDLRMLQQLAFERDGLVDEAVGYANPLIILSERSQNALLPENKHTIPNPGQGNCLYYSIVQGLRSIGIERGDHVQLRVQSLRQAYWKEGHYLDDCEKYMGMSVETFIQKFSRSGEYGQDLCIIALVDFLEVNITVHYRSQRGNVLNHSVVTFSPARGSVNTIEIIAYLNRLHYECVLDGPPIVLPTPPITEEHSSSSSSEYITDEDFSENISSAVASFMPTASEEKLFFVEGRKRRASNSDPTNPKNKTKVLRPIVSGSRFTNEKVSLSDAGVLKIDDVFKMNYDKETMELIKGLGINRSNLSVKNSSGGYLYYGKDALHYILGTALKRQHFDYLLSLGLTGSIDDLTAVSHLDDNSYNNNLSNLLNLPAAWNQNLKKVKGAKRTGNKYYCQLVIAESDTYNTVSVSDPDEALLQYDILKIKHCLDHVKLCPKVAQQIIFANGLVRPKKFVDKGYYKDIKTLLSHADDWIKDPTKQGRKGKTYTRPERFRILKREEVNQKILDSLNAPGNLPFNPLLHVVVEYIGLKRRYQRICNRDFYERFAKHYTGPVHENTDGYMVFDKLGPLHNLALGRKRGDHAKDKLQGCHGVGGKLDNRVTKKANGSLDQRTLTLGSASTNASHIVRKKVGSDSIYPGVSKSKNGKMWISQWRYDNWSYHLGTFDTEIEAANVYAHVQEHREEIAGRLAPVTKDALAPDKKALRAANLIIVKSYIKTSLHDKVKVIRDKQ